MPKPTKTERDERMKKLFVAGRELDAWRVRHELSDPDVTEIMTALGWGHLLSGHQQREAARVTTPKKAASSRENGKLGGRPKKARDFKISPDGCMGPTTISVPRHAEAKPVDS